MNEEDRCALWYLAIFLLFVLLFTALMIWAGRMGVLR